LLKIISGAQSGVDRGALDAALELGIECGGWCPAGRLAEDGTIPKRYPVQEMPTAEYAPRTAQNVTDADGTLIIANGELTGGTRETLEFCRQIRKPHLVIDVGRLSSDEAIERASEFVRALSSRAEARELREGQSAYEYSKASSVRGGRALSPWLRMMTLNVAGPRGSQWPGGHSLAQQILRQLLRRLSGQARPDDYSG
jgi:Circularly permutated YpsA SLOG family